MKTEILIEMYKKGMTLQEIGDIFGVTRERIRQILTKAKISKKEGGVAIKVKNRLAEKVKANIKKYGRETWKGSDLQLAQSAAFTRKKQNVKKTDLAWEIEVSDIDWPTHCPIFGVELDYFSSKRNNNSPSFDRKDNTKGYVKGNVFIISWRANRIKNDGTKEEHLQIVKYLDS